MPATSGRGDLRRARRYPAAMSASRLLLPALAMLAAATPAAAVERLTPAGRLLPYFDFYLGMAESRRDRFRPAYQLLVDGQPYTGPVTLVDGPQRTPLSVGPDGRFDRFPTLDQLKRRPQIAIDAPARARIRTDLGVEALAPRGAEMPVGPLAASIDQLNAAMRSAAGVLAFVVPRFGRAFFVFGGRQGVRVAADGSARPLPLGEDEPVEPFYSPSRHPEAVAVRFPSAPARVLLVPGK